MARNRVIDEHSKKERERQVACRSFKARRRLSGTAACDVCGWREPALVAHGSFDNECTLLHAHHVVPVSCGGPNREENMTLLCPNHHAIAHRATYISGSYGNRAYDGPTTPSALIELLKLIETDPDAATVVIEKIHADAAYRRSARIRSQPIGHTGDWTIKTGRQNTPLETR